MNWARIMVPLNGGQNDGHNLQAGAVIARQFNAELAGVFTPPDIADLMPWMGEGFMGGVQVSAIESVRDATEQGLAKVTQVLHRIDYDKRSLTSLSSPVWVGLSMEGRLSDLIVFDNASARGQGPLAESFQQLVADEQRPVLVAREGLTEIGRAHV